jgi:hypothetical protein
MVLQITEARIVEEFQEAIDPLCKFSLPGCLLAFFIPNFHKHCLAHFSENLKNTCKYIKLRKGLGFYR